MKNFRLLTTRIKKLTNSKFLRNVAIVATGTAGAQAITMVFSPIITRLYGPEAFGLLGTFNATLAIVTPIAALTYPIAIVLPKNDEDAISLAKLSSLLAVVITCIMVLVILIFGEKISVLFSLQKITSLLLLIPLGMLFSAFHQIFEQWLIRKKKYQIKAKTAILQSLTLGSAKTGFGWFHPVGTTLVILATFGHALHALMLWIGMKKNSYTFSWKFKDKKSEKKHAENLHNMLSLAKKHRDFPFFRAPQVTINALSQSLPVLMLASFFGPASVGFYSLGKTVMGLPTNLIGKSVSDVFYPRITEAAHNNEDIFKLVLKATMTLGIVGFIPFTIVMLFGPWLFSFVFGIEWVTAGEYARWMALWIYFMFMNNPSVKTLPVLNAQGFHLIFTFFTIVIRLSALSIGYFIYKDDIIAVMLYGIAGAMINIILITIVLIL